MSAGTRPVKTLLIHSPSLPISPSVSLSLFLYSSSLPLTYVLLPWLPSRPPGLLWLSSLLVSSLLHHVLLLPGRVRCVFGGWGRGRGCFESLPLFFIASGPLSQNQEEERALKIRSQGRACPLDVLSSPGGCPFDHPRPCPSESRCP